MEESARLALIRILRGFVLLFSASFGVLFASTVLYGVFSLSLFTYAFLVCLGLCTVSCFIGETSIPKYTAFGVTGFLFIFSLFTLSAQSACTANIGSSCFYLIWEDDKGLDEDNVLVYSNEVQAKIRSANTLLLLCNISMVVISFAMTWISKNLRGFQQLDNQNRDEDRNDDPHELLRCTIPAVQMESVANSYNLEECLICQEYFQDKHSVVVLKCKHIFHSDCINDWVHRSRVCPICRTDIREVEAVESSEIQKGDEVAFV